MMPELGLKAALPFVKNVEEFGHRVHVALLKVGLMLTRWFRTYSMILAVSASWEIFTSRQCWNPSHIMRNCIVWESLCFRTVERAVIAAIMLGHSLTREMS